VVHLNPEPSPAPPGVSPVFPSCPRRGRPWQTSPPAKAVIFQRVEHAQLELPGSSTQGHGRKLIACGQVKKTPRFGGSEQRKFECGFHAGSVAALVSQSIRTEERNIR